jgi:hypothetical protein
VIPPIFAGALLSFPATIATWIPGMAGVQRALQSNPWVYSGLFVGLIIFFAYFYTSLTFRADDVADNIKKQGGYIPGIRPGRQTADFIERVLNRLTFGGAVYLAAICVVPTVIANTLQVQGFYFGGTALLIVGFPLGFHDTLHHLPVVRQAVIASSFGLRFQGQGFFLTDARTHRGTSGAPVVMRAPASDTPEGDLPWKLLGVHSARMDMRTRDRQEDESLGLNCAWYADILMTLTEEADRPAVAGSLATLRDQDQADAKDQRVSSD